MLKRWSNWMGRVSTSWVTLLALVIFILFTILVLPRQSTNEAADSGESRSPDLSFYYTGNELNHMAENYGEAGREAYVRARFSFDIIWPLVYTFFLCTSISWLAKRGFAPESPWQQTNLVPLCGALFDLLENVSTSAVMISYPHLLPVIAGLAGFFTLVKWMLVGGSCLLLLTCIIAVLWKWGKGKGTQ
jgi:hypothetical protein